jgi:uncharacterized protein (TIGR02466 family)
MKLFSVEIRKISLDQTDHLETLCQEVKQLEMTQSHPVIQGNTISSYAKDCEKIHHLPLFSYLVENIETQAKTYWDYLGYYPDVYPKIYQSWSNMSFKNGDISIHNHCRAPISAVLYLNASPEQGNIVFENPMDLIIGGQPIKMPYKNFTHEVEVNTGDLILFPGYLKHFTKPNLTNQPRITFVANLAEPKSNRENQ